MNDEEFKARVANKKAAERLDDVTDVLTEYREQAADVREEVSLTLTETLNDITDTLIVAVEDLVSFTPEQAATFRSNASSAICFAANATSTFISLAEIHCFKNTDMTYAQSIADPAIEEYVDNQEMIIKMMWNEVNN